MASAVWLPAVALAAIVGCGTAVAQPALDGALSGTVRDATGAVLRDAIVEVASPSLIGGARSARTDDRGGWRLPALPPGTYHVRATAARFAPVARPGVVLDAGATITVDLELPVAAVTAYQEVNEPVSLVDVTTAAVPAAVTSAMLHDLPTSRVLSDLINLVPGVNGDVGFGGSRRSNAIYVDGVVATESSEQAPWLRYTQNWMQQVQVVALGAAAEHGGFTGVAAHAVVRSGANTVSGLGEYWTTRQGWVSNNTKTQSQALQRSFAPERVRAHWNGSVQAGGPLLRDRLWYFGGLDHTTSDRAPAGYAGSGWREEDDTRGIVKVTAGVTRGNRLEGFLQRGRQRIDNYLLGPLVSIEAAGRFRQPQTSWSVRSLSATGSSVVGEVRYSGFVSPGLVEPSPPATAAGPPGHSDQLTGAMSGNLQTIFSDDRSRHDVAVTGTWLGRIGRVASDMKAGFEVGQAVERTAQSLPGGQHYFDVGGAPDLVMLWDGSTWLGRTRRAALYLQGRLVVGHQLTVLPGLRADLFRGSTGAAKNIFSTTPISPRLGIAWDLGPDHRAVLRLSYGQYSDPAFAQAYLLTDDSAATDSVFAAVLAPGVFRELFRSTPTRRSIDPDIAHSYVDQLVAGGERQLGADWSLQAQYIYRRFDRFMMYTRSGAVWDPVERRDPGPDGLLGTSDDGPIVTVYNLANGAATTLRYENPEGLFRRYHAVQAVARRRLAAAWHAQISYTWSKTTGTSQNSLHGNAGIRATGVGEPNGQINGADRTVHDPTSEAKLLGGWSPGWFGGFTVSGVYRYMTGSAWGRTFTARGLGQGQAPILAEPRGTRRVSAINQLDVRVEKSLPLGTTRRVGVFADVFNVGNQGVPDSDVGTPVFTGSGPNLGLPLVWRGPRRLRLAVRLEF